jgi:hypothetical protein
MLILNRFIYKSFYEKEKEKIFKTSLLFNLWNNEDSNDFQSNYLNFFLKLNVYILEKYLRMKFNFFSLKHEKDNNG